MALGVKSGENGHLARPNGAVDGPYCSLTWPSVFGRRCEPLAGRGGGFGGGAAPAPTCGAWGASSVRWLTELRPLFPGGEQTRGSKAVAFHNPQALSHVQEENLSCSRGQVVIARPPVLTPPSRYRRSLVSKGRFATRAVFWCLGWCVFFSGAQVLRLGTCHLYEK
jgi:hypothetical protein